VAPNSGDAVKTFVDAKISIAPNATNEVGQPHTFTVTVLQDDGLTAAQGGDGVTGFTAATVGNVPDYAPCRAALEPIRDALHLYPAGAIPGGGAGVVNATQYIAVMAISSVMPLGRDENNRPLLTQNFEVTWSY